MDFIKNSPMEIIEKDSFWISIELQFKLVCNLPYSLTLHLKSLFRPGVPYYQNASFDMNMNLYVSRQN